MRRENPGQGRGGRERGGKEGNQWEVGGGERRRKRRTGRTGGGEDEEGKILTRSPQLAADLARRGNVQQNFKQVCLQLESEREREREREHARERRAEERERRERIERCKHFPRLFSLSCLRRAILTLTYLLLLQLEKTQEWAEAQYYQSPPKPLDQTVLKIPLSSLLLVESAFSLSISLLP